MKKIFLKSIARISKYTAERGEGWPTYWGFHEIVPSYEIKNSNKKMVNDKKNSK